MQNDPGREDGVTDQAEPSWYLDRLVAAQKRQLHQELIRRWAHGILLGRILKTDLFEEAHGEDQILFDLFPGAGATLGVDLSPSTVLRASARCPLAGAGFFVGDVRSLALSSESVDLIVSNSTLDHFDSRAEFCASLGELARVLRTGGLMIVTVDNARNIFYPPLRWVSRLGWTPFRIGYTTSQSGLVQSLEEAGLEVAATGTLIHNPRLVSTLLFLGLRRLLGARADRPIRALLKLFAGLERLPTRGLTACFVCACARKPDSRS